jgi:hypothetical protein
MMQFLGEYVILPLLAIALAVILFVFIPLQAYTHAQCMRAGYPKASVTIFFERYCLNFDGAVRVDVKEVRGIKK